MLVHHVRDGIAIALRDDLAWNVDEVLLVFRPAQATRQLKIACDIVIGLTEPRIGIQRIRVLAEKIIVAIIIETGERIGVDIIAILLKPFSAAFYWIWSLIAASSYSV